jgi:hypothetical protein
MAIDMLTSRRGKKPVVADVPLEPTLEPAPAGATTLASPSLAPAEDTEAKSESASAESTESPAPDASPKA